MLIIYLVLINIIAFYIYGMDKRYARKGKWRTSENTLLGVALIGGSAGALLGMKFFHHKTKHWKFKIFVPLFLIVHIMLFVITY